MRHAFAPLTLALMALLPGAPSWAGASSAAVETGITLGVPAAAAVTDAPQPLLHGACRSRFLGQRTQAGVEVTCAVGEYASIQAFQAGAYLGWNAAPAAGATDMRLGTVTIRRLFDLMQGPADENGWNSPLEMRVTF